MRIPILLLAASLIGLAAAGAAFGATPPASSLAQHGSPVWQLTAPAIAIDARDNVRIIAVTGATRPQINSLGTDYCAGVMSIDHPDIARVTRIAPPS